MAEVPLPIKLLCARGSAQQYSGEKYETKLIKFISKYFKVFHDNDHFSKQTNRTIEVLWKCAHLHGQAVFKMF